MPVETTGARPRVAEHTSDNPSAEPAISKCQSSKPESTGSSPREKRREIRYPTHDVVEVCILEMGRQRLAGVVRDVSRNGLRIELRMPLSKGARLEIVMTNRAIIFGEARYCRRTVDTYQVGVVIEDVYYAQPISARHIDHDQLSLYLVGKGLSVLEVIHIKNHLLACDDCHRRLSEAGAILQPLRRQALMSGNCSAGPT
jgi:PilZ domain